MNFPLAGNERVKTAVTAAIGENRIPHAILIEGDPGTGKHTLSRYLSSAAVCTGDQPPCGQCRACRQAAAFTHPDIRVTAPEDGKKNIAVAQIRELRQEAYIKPHTAPRRVFVIDKADTMNEQAQNALLKVLEEPPGSVIFLLLAESKAALLPTVLSRCTVFSLAPPAREEALACLRAAYHDPDEKLQDALTEAEGNLGEAIRLLSGESSDSFPEEAERFLRYFAEGKELQMLTVLAPFSGKRAETDRLIKGLKSAVLKALRSALSSPAEVRRLSRLYDILADCEERLITNVNLNLLFCSLVSKAAGID